MTEEERVAHATAVKLMGNKDYFVEVFRTVLATCLEKTISVQSGGSGVSSNKLVTSVVTDKVIEDANIIAKKAMKYIDNFGKEN